MWRAFKCWLGLHDWKHESWPSLFQESHVRRTCKRCPKRQLRFKNQAKGGRVEWIDLC